VFELLMIIALASVVVNIVLCMMIVSELGKRGVKINFFLIRLLLPKYVYQYRKIMIEETGKAGGFFYGWIVSINGALVFAVAGLLVRAL
jgi:hypothetical protein